MLLRVRVQNAQEAVFKYRAMNSKLPLRFLQAITLVLLASHCANAIEIVVPDQYKDQVEAIKEAERAERDQELQEANKSVDSGLTIDAREGQMEDNSGAEVDADEFLVQSVIEATDTAAAIEGSLAADEGVVSGQVVDKESGEPVSGVAILIEGTDVATVTDATGRYSLGPAPAGTYTLTFVKTGYIEANVTEYQVAGGEVSVFPFAMPPRPADMSDEVYELQDFTVTAEQANQLMMELDLRKMSAVQLDIMSSEDFSRYAASDIAEAVKSITGVSLSDGKYAVVRGLNDRYSVTQLNGATLPSPDPDRPAVPLDIFPTGVFQSIETRKTHSPDMPGEASGGLIDLKLLSFPEERILKFSASTGINSESNDKDWLTTKRSGSSDYWASGADDRNFDESVSNPFGPVPIGQFADPATGLQAQLQEARAAVTDDFRPISERPEADFGFSGLYGETFELDNGRRIGVVLAGNHSVKHRYESQEINKTGTTEDAGAEGSLGVSGYMPNVFGAERNIGTKEAQVSVVAGVGYEIEEDRYVNYHYLFTRNGQDKAIEQSGGNRWVDNGQAVGGANPPKSFDTAGGDVDQASGASGFLSTSYNQRTMSAHQFDGNLNLEDIIANVEFDWSYLLTKAEQIEPDTVDSRGPRGPYRFSRETTQDSSVLALNMTTPLNEYIPFMDFGGGTKFKAGYYLEESEREFEQRQQEFNSAAAISGGQISFQNNFIDSVSAPVLLDGALFTAPVGVTGSAEGERKINGSYFMFDTFPTEWLQIVAGFRYEYTQLSYTGFGSAPQGGEFRPSLAESNPIDQLDVIPSINLNIDVTEELKLRFAYSQTVARPTYRELQPFPILNLATNEIEVGNPGRMQQGFPPGGVNPVIEDQFAEYRGLRIAEVKNYDARVEWFPYPESLLALGFFFKEVGNPIERVEAFGQTSSLPVYTFVNNENAADVYGLEVEIQQGMGDLFGESWDFLTVGGNFTYIDAEVKRTALETRKAETEGIIVADVSESRRLYDQPDYIANLFVNMNFESTGSDLTLSLNHTGKRLVGALGAEGPDIYEGAFTTLNLVYTQQIPWVEGMSVKLAAKNLNNPTYRRTTEKGDNTVPLYDESGNQTSSIDLESYKQGVSYSVLVSYNF